MQFAPAFASAAQQKLGARPSGQPVEAASASGVPEHVGIAQDNKKRKVVRERLSRMRAFPHNGLTRRPSI